MGSVGLRRWRCGFRCFELARLRFFTGALDRTTVRAASDLSVFGSPLPSPNSDHQLKRIVSIRLRTP
jgi:hypothetical protein